MKKKYAQIGLGGRSSMYREAILKEFSKTSELVAVCDRNKGRIDLAIKGAEKRGAKIPGYNAEEFDRMISETQPDCIIVTTMDADHDNHICRAMELGCDVITEKPMTINVEKCNRILETEKKAGKNCKVAFNYRYAPPRTQIKDILMSGTIGEVLSVDFKWMLNTVHGADYYRRWHRNKINSGGLLVHKATHHFDLVNWWLSATPTRVFASGQRKFYTSKTGDRLGLSNRTDRCLTCPEKEKCRFSIDLTDSSGELKELYLDCEKYDGYFRDRCVFSDDIDIEDTMHVMADYTSGAKLSYSLNSFSPWEGYHIVFNGTKGRLEHLCQETVYINGDGNVPGALNKEGTWTRIYPQWEPCYEVDLWQGQGGHGGADPVMLSYIFDPENAPKDPYMRAADQRAGAWSIITGIAANQSISTGLPVKISDLTEGWESPEFPAMPNGSEPLPMPAKEENSASDKEDQTPNSSTTKYRERANSELITG